MRRDPSEGIARGLRHLALLWTATALVAVLVATRGGALGTVGMAALTLGTTLCGLAGLHLASAARKARADGDASAWGGLARVHAWGPAEGVVFLHRGQIHFVADRPPLGGTRLVYPGLGERLALRASLEPRELAFADAGFHTREGAPFAISGTLQWRICGLERFFRKVGPRLEVAEQWLGAMAVEKTRSVVLPMGVAALSMPAIGTELGDRIKAAFMGAADWYGFEVMEVSLLDLRLPPPPGSEVPPTGEKR